MRRLRASRRLRCAGGPPRFVGLALGVAGAFAATRFLQSLLFGVGATDPATFLAVPALVFAAALLASWLPALRATRADPMANLRAS